MTSPSPAIREYVRRILAAHPAGAGSSGRAVGTTIGACEQLRVPLVRLAGNIGYAALLSRALLLAKRQDPSLAGLRVAAAGALEELDAGGHGPAGGEAVWNGGAILIAELIGLLVALIGGPLTAGLLREAWPGTPMPNLAVGGEEPL